jgi:hypothetical protein
VGPAADQPRRQVAKLREFDFELTLGAPGPLRENVEDQAGAIQDAAADQLLQIPFLARREGVIDQHELGIGRGDPQPNLLGLAATDEEAGIGHAP